VVGKNPSVEPLLNSSRMPKKGPVNRRLPARMGLRYDPSVLSDSFYRTVTDTAVIVRCVNWTIDPSALLPDKDIIIFADTLALSVTLQAPGRNVVIVAREFNVSNGVIDVSGASETGYLPLDRARDGWNPGQGGSDGGSGPDGHTAGNISIFVGSIYGSIDLKADGGGGGRGQNGGNGAQGQQGPNGEDGKETGCVGSSGGQGEQGGSAGHGGPGGNGGLGGHLSIQSLTPLSGLNLKCTAEGGAGGVPGQAGSPGPGGPGGSGGQSGSFGCQSHGGECWCHYTGRAASGQTGPLGAQASAGASGKDGSSTYVTSGGVDYSSVYAAVDITALSPIISMTQLLMLLHELGIRYLIGDKIPIVNSLSWIQACTSGPIGKANNFETPPSLVEVAALNRQVTSMISQLQLGLDYYGVPYNHVNLVAASVFQTVVQRWLDNSKTIQGAYDKYNAAQTSLDDKRSALANAMESCSQVLTDLQSLQSQIAAQSSATQDQIAQLTNQLTSLRESISSASADFVRDVETSAGCDFGAVLVTISSIVEAATGAYGAIASVCEQAKSLSGLSNIADLVKTVKAIAGDVNSLKQAYADLKTSLSDDSAKLVVEENNFEQTLKPYLSLPSAQRLQSLLQTLVETIRARNQRILAYSAFVVKNEQLKATIAQKQAEFDRVRDAYNLANDPQIVQCAVFIGTLLGQAKSTLLWHLYEENRAFDYWIVQEPTDLPLSGDLDVSQLQDAHNRIQDRLLQAMTTRNGDPVGFTAPLRFTDDVFPAEFDRLRKTGMFNISLPLTASGFQTLASNYTTVTVNEIGVVFVGSGTTGEIDLEVTQMGVSSFLNQAGQRVIFYHEPKKIPYNYPLSDPANPYTTVKDNLGLTDGNFAYLSPYSTWDIKVCNLGTNPNIKLQDVHEIQIQFKGFCLAPLNSRNLSSVQPMYRHSPAVNFGRYKASAEERLHASAQSSE